MLDLSSLANGSIPGISAAVGSSLAEAAGVCLESQGHSSGTQLTITGYGNGRYTLTWPCITDQSRRAWGDYEVATENGAAGVAAMVAEKVIGYAIIERSRKGTGFDYWLGDRMDTLPIERKARLEVSGIRRGATSTVMRRVRQKLGQTDRSENTLLPAYVIVVEFGTPLAEVSGK